MPPKRKKIRLLSIINSRLFLISALVLLFFLFFIISKEILYSYKINQEIKSLETEAAKLEGKNQQLTDLLKYLNSDNYKEREARDKLFLRQPGEKVVAALSAQGLNSGNLGENVWLMNNPEEIKSIAKKWWLYFFS